MVETLSEKVQEYKNKYSYIFENKKGKEHVIPVLKEIQTKEGYLPQHAIIATSSSLEIPLSHVYGVVTFYNFFKLKPQGQYVIAICEGTACHVDGAPKLLKKIKDKLGISPGEMTRDNKFSLEIVRCLGLCAFSPVMLINEKEFTKLDEEKIEQILEAYKRK